MRTCQRLGIKTVAVYSEADSTSHFVRFADESVCIGPASVVKSYLSMETILSAVAQTGADAVHPGYGFLSENYKFAEKLSSIGVSFVGPNAKTMRLLGDKIESKRIASSIGINCVPGYDGEVYDTSENLKIAEDIGGGGKGIRIAHNPSELQEALSLSREEAKSSFGDDRILLERFLPSTRHIEVQILCDRHGTTLHLHTRDCSIQRRNQKLIEEAPSYLFSTSPELHNRICNAAVLLAKAAGYDSAGTVEFLIDSENPKNFYFLEMNTRLQVEHTITECITGIDLVHQMLRIAKGHRLLFDQTDEDIPCRGVALECRVCAEDPYRDLGTPSIGQLTYYKEPVNTHGIRCDSGVVEGSLLSVFYDPLIAKIITYGCDREAVLCSMKRVLDSYIIRGVRTNIALLRDVISNPNFLSSIYTTEYLNNTYPEGFQGSNLSKEELYGMVSLGAAIHFKAFLRNFIVSIPVKDQPNRLNVEIESKSSKIPQEIMKIDVTPRNGYFEVVFQEPPLSLRVPDSFKLSDTFIQSPLDGSVFQICGRNSVGDVCLQYRGEVFWLRIRSKKAFHALSTIGIKSCCKAADQKRNLGSSMTTGVKMIRAPLPGLVSSIFVVPGQSIIEGDEMCILEAMKMRNSLRAPHSGVVKSVKIKEGQTVSEGYVILEIE